MAKESRRLGRGLQSLISPTAEPQPPERDSNSEGLSEGAAEPRIAVQRVPIFGADDQPLDTPKAESAPPPTGGRALGTLRIDQIRPRPGQPRKTFDATSIAGLGESIRQSGLVQPLVVRPSADGSGGYEIVAGERRWRAARAAGIEEVPAIVRLADEREAAELSLIENVQREDLNPIDRAEAYQLYCELYDASADEVGRRLGEDRTTIVNYLRLNELPTSVKDWVREGRLGMGHARSLLGVPTDAGREKLAREAVEKALSVRAVEQAVRDWKSNRLEPSRPPVDSASTKRPQIAHLEEQLQQAVGTKVVIREGRRKGSGKIIIEYFGNDDLQRILEKTGLEG